MVSKSNGSAPHTTENELPPEVTLDVREALRGRRILLTGATGFLGKVFASFLLRYHPDIEQLYLVIRPRRNETAIDRFQAELVDSPAFDPLRETWSDGLAEFLTEKVTVLAGDITDENMGLSEDDARAISATLDLFVNSAGLTNFNPNLFSALDINTLSSNRILDFIRLGGSRAKLLHISTAFVAGRRHEPSLEEVPTPLRYPAYDELQAPFDAEREIEDCFRMIDHVEGLARDQERQTLFAREAREALRKANRDPDDPNELEPAIDEVRRAWVKRRLSLDGRERASHWGWVNIYTYTKSLGERLIVDGAGSDIDYSLVRPAIIESAISYPRPGWNEGMNTTAPICYLSYKGHRFIPTKSDVVLDILPIDMTVGAMCTIGAALLSKQHHEVYHLGSSDLNEMPMHRIVELTTLGTRRLVDRDTHRNPIEKVFMKSLDSVPVSKGTFDRQSLPGFAKAARGLGNLLSKVPKKQLGGVGKALAGVEKSANKIEKLASTGEKIFEIFLPFIHDNHYTFRARNIGALAQGLPADQFEAYGFPIQDLDWRDYWLGIHIPGLYEHVFPFLEEKLRATTSESWSWDDLVAMFDASTKNYADRVALRHHDGGITERWTYAQLQDHARRGAAALGARGITPGHTVMLLSENRPQWGMSYFAILKAGATAVPVDPESATDHIARIARTANVSAVVASRAVLDDIGEELAAEFEAAGVEPTIFSFDSLFALSLTADDASDTSVGPARPAQLVKPTLDEEVASLIFTSGTTGVPKGVMLSHDNFTSLLGSLEGIFRISERDGFLSVLPLHHTFEFTAGFLMPLSKGASVTYLEEMSGEELRSAMTSTKVTALIGVPALWQLLHRRIEQNVASGSPARKWLFERMLSMNSMLRRRFGVNLGPMLFAPVHQIFGGRMRYMVSGASALPSEVLEAFYGLGFDLYEGYGLTEAAPVLTVNRPSDGIVAGSVGKPLPGIEVEIRDADEDGVGEIVARGNNVMLGYYQNDEETGRALRDGWLHTGDLGKIDRKGRLSIVGRSKEIIVTAGGKNVYPDELEDIYGACPEVEEISVVGLPDGQGSERVAALVRPTVPEDADPTEVAEIRQRIREWIRVEGQRVASHNRIGVLKFWDDEFPRTATRKVVRKEIVAILERLQAAQADGDAEQTWLSTIVAQLAGADPARVHDDAHFSDDLGFDSLMSVELASLLAERDIHLTPGQLARIHTFGELRRVAEEGEAVGAMVRHTTSERVDELPIPSPVASFGKRFLHNAQMRAYSDLFDVEVFGRANIPHHDPNVIVVANHASHLDMGLVKYALGDFGRDIRALAAADYFFSNTARKTYFKNFTNLIPVERAGTPDVALKGAVESLRAGETLLMFPEGTRAGDGKLREFRRGLGYLVTSQRVSVLPVYIDGTHRALPKGQSLPNPMHRKLRVRIGEPIDAWTLLSEAKENGLGEGETWDFVARRAYEAVEKLSKVGEPREPTALEPIFEELHGKFEADQVDTPVSFYFSLGQVDDQKWTVIVDPQSCVIQNGKPSGGSADCVVKTSPDVFRRIVQESYIPSFDEFMNGTIKTNSPDLLMRFQSVFGLQR